MSRPKHHDNQQIFDVSKPHKTVPSHTSKPVIINHQTIENDPMLAAQNSTPLMSHSKPVLPIEIDSHHDDSPVAPATTPEFEEKSASSTIMPEASWSSPLPAPSEPGSSSEDHKEPGESNPAQVEPFSGFTPSTPETPHDSKETAPPPSDDGTQPEAAPLPDELTKPAASDPIGLSSVGFEQPAKDEQPEQSPESIDLSSDNISAHPGEHAKSTASESKYKHQEEALPPVPDKVVDVEVLPIGSGSHGHSPNARKQRWAIPAVLVLAAGVYLALDAGAVGSGNVPFELIKQPTAVNSANLTSDPPAQPTAKASEKPPAAPLGFTSYSLVGTSISFSYPSSWGAPVPNTEAGFSKRGVNQQSGGTYAHLIDFEKNPEVQLAITSSKYLPATRAQTYYDFLSWCSGTHDGRIYLQKLLFTTDAKIDTPSTITCSEGPIDANKLNDKTIVQADVKDSANRPIGDVYSLNINNSEYPVMRVKDSTRKNGDTIKELLASVKLGN